MSTQELKSLLNLQAQELIDQVSSLSPTLFGLFPLKTFKNRIYEFVDRCIDVQKQLEEENVTEIQLLTLKREVVQIQIEVKDISRKLDFLPAFTVWYFGAAGLFLLLIKINLGEFLTKTLGVQAPEKLVTLGVMGALIYLAAEYLKSKELNSGTTKNPGKITEMVIRVFLAVNVPIVLVMLFFNQNGDVAELKISPELLSFGCGYSSKLVVDTFNKAIEKASTMIKSV